MYMVFSDHVPDVVKSGIPRSFRKRQKGAVSASAPCAALEAPAVDESVSSALEPDAPAALAVPNDTPPIDSTPYMESRPLSLLPPLPCAGEEEPAPLQFPALCSGGCYRIGSTYQSG